MKRSNAAFGIGLSLAVATFVVAAGNVEAGGARRRHRFKSAPAPVRGKTPALGANGAPDTSSNSPVAGAPAQGAFRQDVVSGGALLAMGPNRALVLNSYRGLSLVDTSDADAPRILASVAVEGTGERMFLGTDEVAVISDTYAADGATTIVTSALVGESSLTVAGVARTAGSLRDATRSGDDLVLVVGAGFYGPMPLTANGTAGGGPAATPNGALKSANAAGAVSFPWSAGPGHVVRARIGADGAPSISGAAEISGEVIADVVDGTEAVLAVQPPQIWQWYVGCSDALGAPCPTGGWTAPSISLVRFSDGADGAPVAGTPLELTGVAGVAQLDRDGATLRALEYGDDGFTIAVKLATYDLSGSAPAPLSAIPVGQEFPATWVFSGGAFFYGTTDWPRPVSDPVGVFVAPTPDTFGVVFDPSGAPNAAGGVAKTAATQGPTSVLHVVDLSDPSNLISRAPIQLGAGWFASLLAVDGGVVGSLNDSDSAAGSTSLFRADVSSVTATASFAGYASLGPLVGDVLLANGGSSAPDGSFVPSATLVGLANGGLTLGGSFSSPSWTSAAARDGDLLGLASYDRLTLVNVADVTAPQVKGELRFVVNVAGFAAISDAAGVALVTDYVGGDVEVRSVALPAADALAPLSTVKLGTGDAQMFAAAPFVYVVATDWATGRASLTVVDATDPANLAVRGSLDLASYPGQVFLKDGALLLLRRAPTLFVDVQKRGRTVKKAAKDAFGKASGAWLKYQLGTVLDVVDLSNPDAPRAARRRFLQWDDSGPATLSGDSLFVPAYVNLSNGALDPAYGYMVAEIDVSNPLRPSVGAPVDVPGQLVAATGEPHRVLTVEYPYAAAVDGATTAVLHVVDLTMPWNQRVLATAPLSGFPEATTVAASRAYVVVETYGDVSMNASPVAPTSNARLLTFDVADLSVASTTDRAGGAYAGQIAAGRLFLRTWGWTGAMDVYSLANPDAPQFVLSQDVAGNSGDVVVVGGRAYAAGGMYGVQSFDLSK